MNTMMHIVFIYLLKTFVYAAKQACNKAKLLEPASINGLLIAPVVTATSIILALIKSRMVAFWYQPTWVELENSH